jgi:hypothetical protein
LDLDRRIRFREADDTRTQEHVDYQRAKWAAEMAGPFDSPIHRAVRLVTGLRRLETTGPHGVR